MSKPEVISVDGVDYVKKDSNAIKNVDGLSYVIVRTYSAGVFAGYLESKSGKEVTLLHARRLWYWKGAASLSQAAVDGFSCPSECKFPCEVSRIDLTEAIEVLSCTQKSFESIKSVKIWEA